MVSEQVLQEVTRRLVEGFHPEAIILFGSQARGTADERSDVDLLVITALASPDDRWPLALAMDRAMAGFDPPLACDILVLTREEFERERRRIGTVARPAFKEGRVLHGRAA